MLDYVWCRCECDENDWDQEVVEVFLQQVESLWRWHASDEQVESVNQHQARALQAAGRGINSANLRDTLIVVDGALVLQW